jgi:hypothetical protein
MVGLGIRGCADRMAEKRLVAIVSRLWQFTGGRILDLPIQLHGERYCSVYLNDGWDGNTGVRVAAGAIMHVAHIAKSNACVAGFLIN